MKINITDEARSVLENRRVKDISIYTEMPVGC
ncbi:hypothetical protein EUAN_17810 [Andreesenia angusta]|uniref:Uncharacterized protein n=1 Tax=Andreesenia angusta TaxID=39480 RepID=A0A1S1V5D9_9FIRM|nr:hypothetical protein EUAN_17810 [Andreesenia angusta]